MDTAHMDTSQMDEEAKKATKKAMDLLLRMDQTEKGLYDKLIRAGFSERAVATAMSYVKSFGYLDDLRYAQNYIGFHKEQYSRKELRYKLAGRGVPPDVVDQALSEHFREDERQALRRQLEKKLRGREVSALDRAEREKLIAYLTRKGYSYSDVRAVMGGLSADDR